MCRAQSENGGRRCPCSHGAGRSAADRARHAHKAAVALRSATVRAQSPAEQVPGAALAEAVAAPVTPAKPRPEPGLYVTSRTQLRRLLAERGARVTILEAERRAHAGAPFAAWDHRALGKMNAVTGDEHGAPVLSDSSVFDLGSGKEWTFEDGLAIRETAMARIVYRFAAAVPGLVDTEEYPELALLKPTRGVLTEARTKAIDDARGEYLTAVRASLATAALDPATAFGAMESVLSERRTAARLNDGVQARMRDMTDAEWLGAKDQIDPEGLELALAESSSWTSKLSGAQVHLERRIAKAKAEGKSSLAEREHLFELSEARRGLAGEARVLAERVARQQRATA